MVKFVTILVSVLSLNTMITLTSTQPKEVGVEFSNQAVAIESGQPVFTKDTKVWVSNPKEEQLKVIINEIEREISKPKVDLSEITNLKKGTYTVILNTSSDEKVFGFTIQ